MRTSTVLALSTALVVFTASAGAWAQGGTFGGGVIAPGSPPVTLAGTSGGPRQARQMGSNCRGTIAMQPDHVIRITNPMQVRFEVLNASGDTTMVIVGPSGVFCDDDSGNGFNPRIIQHFMQGRYQVFIGTYGGGGMYPYTLQVSGAGAPPPPPPPMGGGARFGGANLGPGHMQATLSGTSGGPMAASSYGGNCRGHIGAVPNHFINLSSPMVLTFDVSGAGDTTLVVMGPSGTYCNDDGGNGFNPRITTPLMPGQYQIWVGSYSGGAVYPYTLHIHP